MQQFIESDYKSGKAILFYKRGKWCFAVTIKIVNKESNDSNVMGIDIELLEIDSPLIIRQPRGGLDDLIPKLSLLST